MLPGAAVADDKSTSGYKIVDRSLPEVLFQARCLNDMHTVQTSVCGRLCITVYWAPYMIAACIRHQVAKTAVLGPLLGQAELKLSYKHRRPRT